MTIEQLQEQNEKLKRAITDIYRNCEECEFDGSGTYYAVEQDHVNSAYALTQSGNNLY
ncbi:hook protein [Providencia manganoxydans]|uniref:hook protein n=1 Tax=Providencia manganoxydans TaxID=2923283 RepID=UPI0034E5B22F